MYRLQNKIIIVVKRGIIKMKKKITNEELLNKIKTQNKIIVKQGKIIDNLKFKIQMMETKLI